MSALSTLSENIEEDIYINEDQLEADDNEEKEKEIKMSEIIKTAREGSNMKFSTEDTSNMIDQDHSEEINNNAVSATEETEVITNQIHDDPQVIIRQIITQEAIEKFSNAEAEKIIQEALLIKHFVDEDNSHLKVPRKPIDKLPGDRGGGEGYDRYLLEKLLHSEPDPSEKTFEGFQDESVEQDDVNKTDPDVDGAIEKTDQDDFDTEPSKENNESSQSILHKDFSMSEAFGENTLQTIDEDKELTFNANPVDEAVQQVKEEDQEKEEVKEEEQENDMIMDGLHVESKDEQNEEEVNDEQSMEEEEIVEADIETESSEDEEEDIGEMTYKQKKAVVAAVRRGNINRLEDLLDKRHADMNMHWYNENLLMVAIRADQELMAEFLVDNDIDVNHTCALIERDDNGELTVYPQTSREMAFDRGMTDLVELIDIKTNNIFEFVQPKERNVRIRRPRPPTPPTPIEESEDNFTEEDGSHRPDISMTTEEHTITEDKLKKFERDLDSGLNSSNNVENEQKMNVANVNNNNSVLSDANSNSGRNSHKGSVAESSRVSHVFGMDEGYETMSPVSPTYAPLPPRLEHSIVGNKDHVSIRGTRASHSAKMHNFKTISGMVHDSNDNTHVHRTRIPSSYVRDSRRWHQTKSAPGMRTRQSFESIPELVRTGVPFVHGDKKNTHNNSNAKNVGTVISPYSQVAKLLSGSRLLKPQSASSLPSIHNDRIKKSDSYPIRTETEYIYAERNSANLHDRISFIHQPRASTAGSVINRPRKVR